jgi:hypothetical protein
MLPRWFERSDRQFIEAARSPEARDALIEKMRRARKVGMILWGILILIAFGFGVWAIFLCVHSINTILHHFGSGDAAHETDKNLEIVKVITLGLGIFVINLPFAIMSLMQLDLSIKFLLYAQARDGGSGSPKA